MSTDTPRLPDSFDTWLTTQPEPSGPCPDCEDDHDLVPADRKCPVHGHAEVYLGSEEWQDHYGCPAEGCKHGRWTR